MVRFINDDRVVDYSSKGGADAPPLRLVFAGVPRCATSSMQAAAETLGFAPCMHMANILPHPARERLFLGAIEEARREHSSTEPAVAALHRRRRQELLAELVRGHVGLADFPAMMFAPDFMDMYPGIKIVLNQRPGGSEAWSKACWDSLDFFFTWRFWFTGLLMPTDRLWYTINMRASAYYYELSGIENVFQPRMYEWHNQYIRDEAAKRGVEILEMSPDQGWEPLCKYLEVEVPDEATTPFPHVNEAEAFKIVKAIFVVRGLTAWTALGAGIWASWRFGPAALRTASKLITSLR